LLKEIPMMDMPEELQVGDITTIERGADQIGAPEGAGPRVRGEGQGESSQRSEDTLQGAELNSEGEQAEDRAEESVEDEGDDYSEEDEEDDTSGEHEGDVEGGDILDSEVLEPGTETQG
jgi:hypothetical protein